MKQEMDMDSVAQGLFGGPEDPLLSPKHVAEQLGVGTKTLERWRMTGEGPRFCRLSRKVIRYRASDIAAFISASVLSSTAG